MEENIIKKRAWFVIALIVAGIIMSLPAPDGLTPAGHKAIALLVMVVILFITEAIPAASIALLIGIFEVYVIGIDSNDVAKSYMKDAVAFIMGSLMIAVVVVKHGIAQKIALEILTHVGSKINRIIYGIVATCALTSAFITEHVIAAAMLPVALTISKLSGGFKKNPNLTKLLLFAIAYGCAIGGLATPSGGARNIIMMEYLGTMSNINIGYVEWMIYAFPVTIILIPVVGFLLLRIFKPEVSDLTNVVNTLKKEDSETPIGVKQVLVAVIFLITLALWIFGKNYGIGLGTAAITGAVLYLIFGLARWRDYNAGVAWGVVILYAGAISLGFELMDSGAALWLADKFLSIIPASFLIPSFVSCFTILMTNMMSDGATVSVIGPIMLQMAHTSGINPLMIGLITSISSAFAYMLIIGNPPNAIIHSSGFVTGRDFLKAGIIMTLISFIVMLLIVNVYWIGILGLN
ncbi:hypothetical protein BEH94_05490 [Candidatus Altiarchaeales archaeon WOR_SM1_SCG]|nr:hypothetical protein BEH94_05490 [Candidatus Altiarchaeales archaeon WOR_SM1_SCG]